MLAALTGLVGGGKTALIAGAAAAVAAVVGLLWLQLHSARAEADLYRTRAAVERVQLDHTLQTAEGNALAATELRAELERRDELLAEHVDRQRQREQEKSALLRAEETATREASLEYRDCVALPVPESVARLLRIDS